jgi:hypothetical protein
VAAAQGLVAELACSGFATELDHRGIVSWVLQLVGIG